MKRHKTTADGEHRNVDYFFLMTITCCKRVINDTHLYETLLSDCNFAVSCNSGEALTDNMGTIW
jgi:hypothetical protein